MTPPRLTWRSARRASRSASEPMPPEYRKRPRTTPAIRRTSSRSGPRASRRGRRSCRRTSAPRGSGGARSRSGGHLRRPSASPRSRRCRRACRRTRSTRSRNAPRTSSRKSMSVNAAVPRITRSAPARSASRTAGSDAQAAAELHRDGQVVRDRLDVLEVLRRPGRARRRGRRRAGTARPPRPTRGRPSSGESRVDRLRREVALDQAHRLAVEDVDRPGRGSRATSRADRREVAQQRQAVRRRLLRMELRAEDVPRATTERTARRSRRGRTTSASSRAGREECTW